jgi:carboxyl-terminal processing protease
VNERSKRPEVKILIFVLCLNLAVAHAAESVGQKGKTSAEVKADQEVQTAQLDTKNRLASDPLGLILLERKSRIFSSVVAVPDEPAIANRTAYLLSNVHYLRQPFDDAISSKFLDRYLVSLDPLHMHFVQSDITEFEKYRTQLDDATKDGDTGPAREIFTRFMQRLEERMRHVHELLKTEKYDFSGDDRYHLNRSEAAWPKDLEEAKDIWRQHLRYEVLQEKLNYKGPKRQTAAKSGEAKKPEEKKETAVPTRPDGLPDDIITSIARRYARILRAWREVDGTDVLQVYLSALTHVYDPHSDYLDKKTLENFAVSMNLSLFGIGALLQSEDGYCKIKELKPGPAMRSNKIKPGDRIVAVAQGDAESVDVVDMKLAKVVDMIRGPKDSKVRLTLIPVDASDPSERVDVALVRDEIKLVDEEAKAKVIEACGKDGNLMRLGIIDLQSFYASFDVANKNGRASRKSTTEDVAKLIKKLTGEKVAGIILDLRRNGGGSLEEAINLTGLFIKDGPVVQVRDASGKVVVDDDPDPSVQYDGPLIVLTSRSSASASEILAAALQDYGRALIVGDTSTHGKGTVQSLLELEPYVQLSSNEATTNNPGALKITIRKFYRANGSSTQLKGVTPDIVLPSLNNYAEIGEASLDNPMAWDTIPSAKYKKLNRIQPLLPELQKRSEERIGADKDFAYLGEDIEIYKKFLADKTVSLNEETRRREKKETEDRLEARKKERKLREEAVEKVYELTLKQVGLPGLPPPAPLTNDVSKTEAHALLADDADDTEAEDKTPAVDIMLKEAKRILLDLISLSAKETAVAGRR